MKLKKSTRFLTLILSLLMVINVCPLSAFASIPDWEDKNVIFEGTSFGTDGYYNVISKKDYVLVPGAAVESEMVINNAEGTRRQVLHIIEVDPSNPDVSIVPGYYQIDKDLSKEENWSHKELTEMAKYYEENLGYNIVGGMNTDLYYSSYSPRVLVYNGKSIGNFGKNVATGGAVLNATSSILYVFKDAEGNISCDVKAFNKEDLDKYLKEGILLHAVGVSFGMVVKDGALVSTTVKRGTDDAARSMVGVKEDGTLVICMNDGRGANNSVGFSSYEEGEAMLALGCKWAANCDGGGSSTFLTKRAGEETFTMRSVPCDGAQRPTAHGIFVASNVGPTGELDVINVETDYDFYAPGVEFTFGAKAIDTHGYEMAVPSDVSWQLSDASYGSMNASKFISNGKKGEVDVQIVSGGKVVGSKTITIADPTNFALSQTSTVVPYSTSEKVRTISIPIVAMIGEANVYYDTNAISVSLSDSKAGTLDGFSFTATDDTAIASVDITVEYKATGDKLVYKVEFGKGSEIIYDFEDGGKSGFMGFEEAKKWSKDNGVANTLVGDDPLAGQFNEYLSSKTFTATAEQGGQVRNGNYALAWRLDNTDAAFASWSYNVLFNTGETKVLRDVANGKKATTLGMWLYIPEGAPGLAFQSQLYIKNDDGTFSCKQDHFTFETVSGVRKNLNSCTEADIPESRWVYASIDISKYDYLCTPIATDEGNSRSPSFIRTYVKPASPAELTFYIDDITLDYSSAVDDRVLPVISNPTYSTADTAVDLAEGVAIDGTKLALSAKVSDNLALDNSTGKIFVDGIEVKSTVAGGALSSAEDVNLLPGAHKAVFEIKDELGNRAHLIRNFTVKGDAVITVSGHNDSGEAAKAQSVYYVDIKAADLTSVKKLSASLELNTANTWETEGIVVADGFEAEFDYNEVSKLLNVTVEIQDAAMIDSEADTLVSIPVRVWTYDRYNYVTEAPIAVESMGNKPVVNVICDAVYGQVELNNKTTASFGGGFNAATELTTISSPYHIHDEELTVLNKAPTLSSYGYENRTYCESCKSVVDWGTKLEKLDHNYAIVGDRFVCSDEGCGKVYESGTGVFEMNGSLYYSIGGKLVTGWQDADEGAKCFAYSSYKLATGKATINGIEYDFGENGSTYGAWVEDENGTKFSYGPAFYSCATAANPHANVAWATIHGKTYAFDRNGYRHENISILVESNNPAKLYEFTADGALIGDYTTDHSGIFVCNNGTAYLENGTPVAAGLVKDGKDYYYINSGFRAVTGSYHVTRTNGLLDVGTYEFDADGKMINPPGRKHGVIDNCLYINDELQLAYQLVEFEGDFYFINNGKNEIARNITLYLGKQFVEGKTFADGTPLSAGNYDFDADGKMIVKHGLIGNCIYINGVLQHAYQLVEFEGDFYFINNGKNEIARNTKLYLSKQFVEGKTFANGTPVAEGFYDFDADGKMVIKHGIIDNCIYINGVLQKAYQLVEFDGAYYFINNGKDEIARNTKLYLSQQFVEGKTFADGTPVAEGFYDFDADGKMVIKHGIIDNCIYINGVLQKAYQLVEFEGAHYFINNGKNEIAKNTKLYLSQQFVEGHTFADGTPIPVGFYEFDADGKMIVKNGPDKDGYFYLNGVVQPAYQLIKYEGSYYFINDYNKYAVNKTLYLTDRFVGGTDLEPWYYQFGPDGRMVGYINGIRNCRDIGDIYYYKNSDGVGIKKGMLIRGSEVDSLETDMTQAECDAAVKYLSETYKIKLDMDLRSLNYADMNIKDAFGPDVKHNYYGMVFYTKILTDDGKEAVRKVFSDLADADNYPVYMHCARGVDRTGIITYILGALLGVPESRLANEYMLSVTAYGNDILDVRDELKTYGKSTLKENAEAYLLDCGVTQEEIDSIREILLDD